MLGLTKMSIYWLLTWFSMPWGLCFCEAGHKGLNSHDCFSVGLVLYQNSAGLYSWFISSLETPPCFWEDFDPVWENPVSATDLLKVVTFFLCNLCAPCLDCSLNPRQSHKINRNFVKGSRVNFLIRDFYSDGAESGVLSIFSLLADRP